MPNASPRRVAALYDVHGNLPALEAALDAVRAADVDEVIVGGDVLPGPMPRACLERLRALDVPTAFLLGNGDRETLAARRGGESTTLPAAVRDALRWCAAELTPALAGWVATWPTTVTRAHAALGTLLFCHATPTSDVAIVTARTPDDAVARAFGGRGADVVVCGHTHMAYDRHVTLQGVDVRVVNAGSVGMPFGAAGAHWLLLDDGVHLRHTVYDLAAAAARVRATDYPQADDFAATNVLQPPSAALMLDRLSPP